MSCWMLRAFAVVAFLASGAMLHAGEVVVGMYRFTLPDGFVNEPGKGYDTILGVFRSADGQMRCKYSLELQYNGFQPQSEGANKMEAFLTPLGEGMLRRRDTKEGVLVDFLLPPDLNLSCQTSDGAMPKWFKGVLESMASADPAMVSVAKSLVTARPDDGGKGVVISLKKDIIQIPGKNGETSRLISVEAVGAGRYESLNPLEPKPATMTLDAQLAPRQALIMTIARLHPKGVQRHRVRIAIPALMEQKQDDPGKR